MPRKQKEKVSKYYGNIRFHMSQKGLTIGMLAQKLHMSRQSLSKRLSGEIVFSYDEAKRLSKIFEVSVDHIMEFKLLHKTSKQMVDNEAS